jgi:hypothetical protein
MDLEHAAIRRMAAGVVARVGVVTIPVVVHVVVCNTAAENISVAQIKSQISVLNRDYRTINPDKAKSARCLWGAGG